MFTGIIEEIGKVRSIRRGAKSFTLEIAASTVLEDTLVGDSIATNGVCLTVTGIGESSFTADVMPETVSRTSLFQLKPGCSVNLERALTLQKRLGGHIVSGHVDGTGRIDRRYGDDNALWLWIECDASIMRYVVEKGSITIQGVSLTVAKVEAGCFAVSLIPHTQSVTTLHSVQIGDIVNLENDIIAKYVEQMMNFSVPSEETDKIDLYRKFMS